VSQRESGYERKERDVYETPAWVTDCLIAVAHMPRFIWEPAAGSGQMVRALRSHNHAVYESDISTGEDFLMRQDAPFWCEAIVTNPPYNLAREFIEHALALMEPLDGTVAMLLRTDYDHAKTRQHLFGNCDAFRRKIVLTKRIKWFEDSRGAPSFNHAWFIWDWRHHGAAILSYAP
jgi:hypothetical protein